MTNWDEREKFELTISSLEMEKAVEITPQNERIEFLTYYYNLPVQLKLAANEHWGVLCKNLYMSTKFVNVKDNYGFSIWFAKDDQASSRRLINIHRYIVSVSDLVNSIVRLLPQDIVQGIRMGYDNVKDVVTLTVAAGYYIQFGENISNALGLTALTKGKKHWHRTYLPYYVYRFGPGRYDSPSGGPTLRPFRNSIVTVSMDVVQEQIVNNRYNNNVLVACCDEEQSNGRYYRYKANNLTFFHDLNCNVVNRINIQVRDEAGDIVGVVKDHHDVSELVIVLEFRKKLSWSI